MHHNFHQNGSFEDFAREIGNGIREFIEEIKQEAGSFDQKFGPGCWSGKPGFQDSNFSFRFKGGYQPRYTRYTDSANNLVFEFMLPGFEEDGINLSFKGDSMILKASLPENLKADGEDRHWRPGMPRDIERSEYFVPAARYLQNEAKAVLKNGILKVSIPAVVEDDSDAIKVEIVKEGI